MQLLPNLLLLAHQLKTGSALRVLDNGLQLPVYGAEEKVVDYAVLASDQKAALPSQVQQILDCFESLLLFFQFSICSSATSDAWLSLVVFFQLFRHSGKPWISFQMDPRPGQWEKIFRLSVRKRVSNPSHGIRPSRKKVNGKG